jgi:hypothetical protein
MGMLPHALLRYESSSALPPRQTIGGVAGISLGCQEPLPGNLDNEQRPFAALG